MVLAHEGDYPSRWSAVVLVADKIGCVPQTLHEWVKEAEVDAGRRAGVSTDTAEKLESKTTVGQRAGMGETAALSSQRDSP
jgi:transposase